MMRRRLKMIELDKLEELKDLKSVKKGDLLLLVYKINKVENFAGGIGKVYSIKIKIDGKNINHKDKLYYNKAKDENSNIVNVKVKLVYLSEHKRIGECITRTNGITTLDDGEFNNTFWRCFKIYKKDIKEVKKLIDYDAMFRYEEIKKDED